MNLYRLSLSYLRRRALATALNVVLLALGIATIVVLLLVGRQFEDNLSRNAAGIDLVVGAKGSPATLILSSLYHLDAPTGNIPVAEAQRIMQNRAVRQAIPLALGDSYRGVRIVGTRPDYLDLYEAALAEGTVWDDDLDVVLGAETARTLGLGLGDTFESTHGLSEGGMEHGERPLRVVGVLAPSGTVVDRLILTSVETIWTLHDTHPPESAEHPEDEGEAGAPSTARPPMMRPGGMPPGGMPQMAPGGMPGPGASPDYTALLIQYSSPLAAAMFPRYVNSQTNLQAASPAFEIARLTNLLGVGLDALRAFGILLILAAALSVFVALYNALKERRYDLAMMRTVGASRGRLFAHVLLEGVLLALLGALLGLVLGHLAAEVLGAWVAREQGLRFTGWAFVAAEVWLVLIALAVGALAAFIPAVQAYRTDIAQTLVRA